MQTRAARTSALAVWRCEKVSLAAAVRLGKCNLNFVIWRICRLRTGGGVGGGVGGSLTLLTLQQVRGEIDRAQKEKG